MFGFNMQQNMSPFGPSKMPGFMAPGMNRGPIQQMPMNGQMNPPMSNGMQGGMAGPSGDWMQRIMQMLGQGNQTANQPAKNIFESMRF